MTDLSTLTAKERLALSREALVLQLHGGKPPVRVRGPIQPAELPAIDGHPIPPVHGGTGSATTSSGGRRSSRWIDQFAWVSVGKSIARRWWRRHPANAATQLARPLLDHYARERPATLVASAAATGALMVLLRPWRLLSITAVLAALLKTSDIADLVTTVMHRNADAADAAASPL